MYNEMLFALADIDWISIADKFGIPMGILAAFAYFVGQSIKWFGSNVVVPMKDRHMSFLDNMENCLDKITDLQTKIYDDTTNIRSDIDKVERRTTSLAKDSGLLREKVDGLSGLIIQSMVRNGKYDSMSLGDVQSELKKGDK